MEGFARQSTQTINVLAKKDTMENIASLVATIVTLIRVRMVVYAEYQTLKVLYSLKQLINVILNTFSCRICL